MSQDGGGNDSEGSGDGTTEGSADFPTVEGQPIDEAVETIVAADDDHDPDTVRQALSHVSEDGVVTEDAVEDAVGHLATVVSTPETRVELAANALDDAREAAEPVADLDVVQSRVDAYEGALADLEDRRDDLRDALQVVVDLARDTDSLYALGRDIQGVIGEANAVQQRADELQVDLEEFDAWLDDPETRAAQLAQDADTVETTIEDLLDVADALEAMENGDGESSDESDDDSSVSVPGEVEITDPAVAWVDASFRERVVALLLADLRAELADLRTWADREGVEPELLDDVAIRLDALDDRATILSDRLDALARPAWTDRFGDRLAAYDDQLGDRTAPVDWADVEATIAEHRTAVLGNA